jgi:hypothetical protein
MPEAKTDVKMLSAEAQAVVDKKRLSGRLRFSRLRKLLAELRDFDAVTDKLQSRSKGLTCLMIVLVLVLGIVTAVLIFRATEGRGDMITAVLPGLPAAICAVLLVVFAVRWRRFAKADLDNQFRTVLVPFLEAISQDVEPKAKVGARIGMSGLTKEKIVSKQKIPPGRYRKIIETVYKDPWCNLQVELADGSRMMLRVEDQATSLDLHWTKRSSSGKTKFKHKRKWKKLVVVTAALVPEAEKLSWDEADVEQLAGQEKLKLADKKFGRVCRLVRKFKYGSVGSPPTESVGSDEIIPMFMQLYSMLNPVAQRSES